MAMRMGVMMLYQQYHHTISPDQMFDRMLEGWSVRSHSLTRDPSTHCFVFRYNQELFQFSPDEAKERLVRICDEVCSPLAASVIRNAVF